VASVPVGCASRLLLARVGDRWIAHPLSGNQALRTELLPADAEGCLEPGQTRMPTRLTAIHGFDHVVSSHLDVAHEVWAGRADAGVSAAAIATAFGLGFVPLQQVRYDIVVRKEYFHDALVEQLLNTLISHRFRAQLQALGGYDTQHTADIVAILEPGSATHNSGDRRDRHG
jgi:hypothetical protein